MENSMIGKVFYTSSRYDSELKKVMVTRESDKTIWLGSNNILKRLIKKNGSFSIGSTWHPLFYYPETEELKKQYENQIIIKRFKVLSEYIIFQKDYETMSKILNQCEAK